MNISIKHTYRAIRFEKLSVGDVFIDTDLHSETAFMKIKEMKDTDKTLFNAVDLSNGQLLRYYEMDIVHVVSATLEVEL